MLGFRKFAKQTKSAVISRYGKFFYSMRILCFPKCGENFFLEKY